MKSQSEEELLVIHKLTNHFYKGSHKFNLDLDEVESLTCSAQEKLLNLTVYSDLQKMYPVSRNFCLLYLKNILKYMEGHQDIHEEIYAYLCSILSNKQETGDFAYKHYVIENNFSKIITLKETKHMVMNGTTGMKTWEAALLLTDWILSNKEIFKNKKILELGSGVGFTGITAIKFCDISSLTFTDCHEDVLRTITNNIKINFPDVSQREEEINTVYDVNGKTMKVLMLDWNDIDEIKIQDSPDILIGADIVYDPCILEPLCKVLHSFFIKNKSISVFIASVIRNEDTFKKFFQTLGAFNMKGEKLNMTKNINLDWEPNVNQCIIEIHFEN